MIQSHGVAKISDKVGVDCRQEDVSCDDNASTKNMKLVNVRLAPSVHDVSHLCTVRTNKK